MSQSSIVKPGASGKSTTVWLRCLQAKEDARLRLFCFPFAGGGGAAYRGWAAQLPGTVEVWTAQLPGRESRLAETPFTDMKSLVAAMAPALLPSLNLPFAFFGHSMGTLVSFELTRFLRRHYGLQPLHLLVSGHRAPHLPDPDPHIHALPDELFFQEVMRFNGTPPELFANEELARIFMPILRADLSVCENYVYAHEDPLHVPITVFGGSEDDGASLQELEAWCELTTEVCTVHQFPGDHFYLRAERDALLEKLNSILKRHVNTLRLKESGAIFDS